MKHGGLPRAVEKHMIAKMGREALQIAVQRGGVGVEALRRLLGMPVFLAAPPEGFEERLAGGSECAGEVRIRRGGLQERADARLRERGLQSFKTDKQIGIMRVDSLFEGVEEPGRRPARGGGIRDVAIEEFGETVGEFIAGARIGKLLQLGPMRLLIGLETVAEHAVEIAAALLHDLVEIDGDAVRRFAACDARHAQRALQL